MAAAPASLVLPLAISDLPVFLRWRGEPPFGVVALGAARRARRPARRRLVGVGRAALPRARRRCSTRVAVSDIEWARTFDWRVKLASYWPGIREQEIRVRGPRAEAALLRGWLASRLRRTIRPVEPAGELGVRLGGEELRRAGRAGALVERPAERGARPLRPRPRLRGRGAGRGLSSVRLPAARAVSRPPVSEMVSEMSQRPSQKCAVFVPTLCQLCDGLWRRRSQARKLGVVSYPPRIEFAGGTYHVNAKAVAGCKALP